jgi:hypothetical protein
MSDWEKKLLHDSISSVNTKCQLVPKTAIMISEETKPHKWSENATAVNADLKREAAAPVDQRGPDSSIQAESLTTDNCSTRDTIIPTSASESGDESELELVGSFALAVDSSSSVDVASHLDLMGRFACTCADIFFDDKSVESFHSLEMVVDNENMSLDEICSYDNDSLDDIEWNYDGALNRHADNACLKEMGLEDSGSLGKSAKVESFIPKLTTAVAEVESQNSVSSKVGKDTIRTEAVAKHRIAKLKSLLFRRKKNRSEGHVEKNQTIRREEGGIEPENRPLRRKSRKPAMTKAVMILNMF